MHRDYENRESERARPIGDLLELIERFMRLKELLHGGGPLVFTSARSTSGHSP